MKELDESEKNSTKAASGGEEDAVLVDTPAKGKKKGKK